MTSDGYTRSDQKRYTLRIDAELFEKVKESAETNKRSIAKEIEFILECFFDDQNKGIE